MDTQASNPRIDVNRGLRDRLDHHRTAGTSDRQAVELTLAVSDLQGLARSRFASQSDDPER